MADRPGRHRRARLGESFRPGGTCEPPSCGSCGFRDHSSGNISRRCNAAALEAGSTSPLL
eukprot:scaffold48_cov395-Prasinococcus_capsulatus_cf.AAC.12